MTQIDNWKLIENWAEELDVDYTDNTPDTGLVPRTYHVNDAQLEELITLAKEEERKLIVEEIKKIGVNTPEQLRTLNEGLPSTIQEQEYLKGLGYWKCLDSVIELINKIK